MSVGPWQILVIVIIVLILFGGSRLGEIGTGLGSGIRNFKQGFNDPGPPRRIQTTKIAERPLEPEEAEPPREDPGEG
jgi:sec-independent protein translocase protein TatA